MTTAPPHARPGDRPALVGSAVRCALLVALAGAAGAVVAALLDGAPAAAGVGLGTAMVCAFFGLGTVVVGVVAAIAPAASLLVALLTYSLQVLLTGVVLVVLNRSGALDAAVDAAWLAGAVIGGTLLWLATQISAHTRSRRPLYDLPNGPEASAR